MRNKAHKTHTIFPCRCLVECVYWTTMISAGTKASAPWSGAVQHDLCIWILSMSLPAIRDEYVISERLQHCPSRCTFLHCFPSAELNGLQQAPLPRLYNRRLAPKQTICSAPPSWIVSIRFGLGDKSLNYTPGSCSPCRPSEGSHRSSIDWLTLSLHQTHRFLGSCIQMARPFHPQPRQSPGVFLLTPGWSTSRINYQLDLVRTTAFLFWSAIGHTTSPTHLRLITRASTRFGELLHAHVPHLISHTHVSDTHTRNYACTHTLIYTHTHTHMCT